ncbi:class I SAM-dependent methyltransferase [Mycoplasmatota bacterium zrk1]
MNHYYMNNNDLKSEPKEIRAVFSVCSFSFITDNGVFSKGSVDYGSKVLINALSKYFETIPLKGKRVLDVGCGYGPIGIVLGTLYPKLRMDMVDISDRAIELARNNIKLNNVSNVSIFKSNLYDNVTNKYSIIISNPPIRAGKHIVHAILENAKKYLEDLGELWIVIQKKQGAPSAKKRMIHVFGNAEVVERDKGYFIIRSINKN